MELDLLTLLEHLSSSSVFSWIRVLQALVFCVVCCRSLFVLLSHFFGHCIVCPCPISLVIVLSVLVPFLWSLYCLSLSHFFGHCIVCPCPISLVIVLSVLVPFLWSLYCLSLFPFFGHCIVCPCSISLVIVLSVLVPFLWSLYCLSLFHLRRLITPMVSSNFSYAV